jgi:hypothetical protein
VNRDKMLAPFADEELKTFGGRGGKTMTYIEDETVMDRLDAGYGPGNWSIEVEPFPYVDGVVKVTLAVKEGTEWVRYQDFGYPNREGGESLKEAVSDGIRRCGRFVGIARDLYRKDSPPVNRGDRPTPPPAARSAPQRPPAPIRSVPVSDDLMEPDEGDIDALFAANDTARCAIHDLPWIGSPGDQYHRQAEGGYCRHPNNVKKAIRR